MSVSKRLSSLLCESGEKKFNEIDAIMEYEQGDLSNEDTIKLFSHLVKTGKAWSLQGHYGRMAKSLMDAGYIDKKGAILKTECLKNEATVMEAKNTDVIDMFITDSFPKDKKPNWGTENLKINKEHNGWSLVNYSTVIVYRPNDSDNIYLNKKKYSVTTSKIQHQIRNAAIQNGIKLIELSEAEVYEVMNKDVPGAYDKAHPVAISSKGKEGDELPLFPQD